MSALIRRHLTLGSGLACGPIIAAAQLKALEAAQARIDAAGARARSIVRHARLVARREANARSRLASMRAARQLLAALTHLETAYAAATADVEAVATQVAAAAWMALVDTAADEVRLRALVADLVKEALPQPARLHCSRQDAAMLGELMKRRGFHIDLIIDTTLETGSLRLESEQGVRRFSYAFKAELIYEALVAYPPNERQAL